MSAGTAAPDSAAGRPSPYARLLGWIAGIEDGAVLRVAFFGLLLGTVSVLVMDYRALMDAAPAAGPARLQPILPPFSPDGDAGPRPAIVTDPARLEAPLEIVLGAQGELRLTGSIDVGSALRFAEEIEARGEYVDTVVLDSPGGSVADALAIGTMIHERGYDTYVAEGGLCASSCPIVFASGAERIATEGSAIGVHQVYAAAVSGDPTAMLQAAGMAMSEAQRTTAQITRHLSLTGVDPAMWLHALETPPDRLYYFSPEEMTDLNLVTQLRS